MTPEPIFRGSAKEWPTFAEPVTTPARVVTAPARVVATEPSVSAVVEANPAPEPFWQRTFDPWLEALLSKERAPACAGDCDSGTACRACELRPGPSRHGWQNAWPEPPGVWVPTDNATPLRRVGPHVLGTPAEKPAHRRHQPDFDPAIHVPETWPDLKAADERHQRERFGARPLAEISTDPPPPLLIDRLDPEGHSILYGTGGVGKGTLAAWWTVQLVRAGRRVLIVDYENHPGEWARRIHGLGGADAVAGVVHVAPLTAAWQGVRGPLWQQAEELRNLAAQTGSDYVVIDSIVPACAGFDPMKPEAAALYAGGLELIEYPALSLAHVTKAEELRYPFGSAFWHNLARTTWSLKREGEGAILAHRKHNNYASLGKFVVNVTWLDDLPREVWEQGYSLALGDRIDEALGSGALSVAEIVALLNEDVDDDEDRVKANSVRTSLRRGLTATAKKPQRYTVEGTDDSAKYRRVTA